MFFGRDADSKHLVLFSKSGFSKEIIELASARCDVQLVGLEEMYRR